jgi:hypothetical protein
VALKLRIIPALLGVALLAAGFWEFVVEFPSISKGLPAGNPLPEELGVIFLVGLLLLAYAFVPKGQSAP